jgi:hypothetical protein
MPLSVYKLPRSALHPMVDKMADKLPKWKDCLMHCSGRLVLVKSTLSAIPMYTAINLELPSWLHQAFEKIMKSFLWSSTNQVQGGNAW